MQTLDDPMDDEMKSLLAQVRAHSDSAALFNRLVRSAQQINFDRLNPDQITEVLNLGLRAAWKEINESKGLKLETCPESFVSDDTKEVIKGKVGQIKGGKTPHYDDPLRLAAIAVCGFTREHNGAMS